MGGETSKPGGATAAELYAVPSREAASKTRATALEYVRFAHCRGHFDAYVQCADAFGKGAARCRALRKAMERCMAETSPEAQNVQLMNNARVQCGPEYREWYACVSRVAEAQSEELAKQGYRGEDLAQQGYLGRVVPDECRRAFAATQDCASKRIADHVAAQHASGGDFTPPHMHANPDVSVRPMAEGEK